MGPMPNNETPPNPRYAVAVRQLCEFTARCGDLDLRFSASPTGQEGIAGHALVAQRRSAHYEREVALSADDGLLTVRGRADGYDARENLLEEVKTYRGRFDSITPQQQALHWAQAQIYGHLMCQMRGLERIDLALVYLNLENTEETVLRQTHEAAQLQAFYQKQCTLFVAWAEQELAHQAERAQALQALNFPFAPMRPGQRTLAQASWHAARQGRCLMVQAPTGIGKTLGTLFPSLKAMGKANTQDQTIDKLFYLSAKSSGRDLALRALTHLALKPGDAAQRTDAAVRHVRVLELMAREKACEHPDKACHGQSCPLAQGYYDKLPGARAAAVASGQMDAASLRALALDHGLCPYHLAQELIAWADVVVGDYNHWFDSHATLYSLSMARSWRVAVLVDEAHNLVERGRQMYSAELDEASIKAARQVAPPPLKKDIARLQRQWRAMRQGRPDYSALPEPPAALLTTMAQTSAAIGAWQGEHPSQVIAPLQRLWFDLLAFSQRCQTLGQHSLVDLTVHDLGTRSERAVLSVRNVVPAHFLKPRLLGAQSCVLFSATLTPTEHYTRMLGLPEDSLHLQVPSPFRAEQLDVRILQGVSTRWRDRSKSLQTLVDVMADQWLRQSGKYLAFFSSFDYLSQASQALEQRHPLVPQWQQKARMGEPEQRAFVERFRSGEPGIGFAVLGGSFAEGIDLPGQQLIGAFIATLGLPQLNPVNEELRRRIDALMGQGYEHAYMYPGLRKVVQAAGRVIRDPDDQGVLWLMDERFTQKKVIALLPPWWQLKFIAPRDAPAMRDQKPWTPAEPHPG